MRRETWRRLVTDLKFFPLILSPVDIDNIFEVCSTQDGIYSELNFNDHKEVQKQQLMMNYVQFVEGLRLISVCYLKKENDGYFDWRDVEMVLEHRILPKCILLNNEILKMGIQLSYSASEGT
eukprot:TRINITY_DN80922_c0_g1_i2.p2 TRINITY_DN80922_c0_g1~~TRINITY_DN80922_c0_g1_i2.p2  ORF type:complete len:122 (-),score=15.55 TRINITY_DN80922_c0_g1_i2:30-395(-)